MKDFIEIKKKLLAEFITIGKKTDEEISAFISGMTYLEDFLFDEGKEQRLNDYVPDKVVISHLAKELEAAQVEIDKAGEMKTKLEKAENIIENFYTLSKSEKRKVKADVYVQELIEDRHRLKRALDYFVSMYISERMK